MSEFTKQNTAATEQYLAFVAKSQEQILEQARQLAAAVGDAAPQAAAIPTDVPTPRELTMAAFSFSEKLIAQQRAFMEQYLDIAEHKPAEAPATSSKKG